MDRWIFYIGVLLLLTSCLAEGVDAPEPTRRVLQPRVIFDQTLAVKSSVLTFELDGTSEYEGIEANVQILGTLGEGHVLEEEFLRDVERHPTTRNLVVRVPVEEYLWFLVQPQPRRLFTGSVHIRIEDRIGLLARATLDRVSLSFVADYAPHFDDLEVGRPVWPNEAVVLSGDGMLRPEEGTTWAVVQQGVIVYPDMTSRPVQGVRIPLEYNGRRDRGILRIHPTIFGVLPAQFQGSLHFENELRTGEIYEGSTQELFTAELRRPRIDGLSPDAGSRGQKITVSGRGFVPNNDVLGFGMYLEYVGRFTPDDPDIPPMTFQGANAVLRVPFRVVDERVIEQDVWYDIDRDARVLTGLGATPGIFDGTITPYVFDATGEVEGEPWRGTFRVLPTLQVVKLKYLPAFSRALDLYGLGAVEREVRDRILEVLERDYQNVNIRFGEAPPTDFIDYTTVEISGPDPSGLLNFGYDNSYNDGGKDVGNLFLGDYLGGVNRHSEQAGYAPYGGIFIESFIVFSPTLFPDGFGTSADFDRIMGPFMPGLKGSPVRATEWPDGRRAAEIRAAIDMIGNLTGHTASHEIGHALGLAYFPPTVPGFDERYHNDPPGPGFLMNGGIHRPFDLRAEINGEGPARFAPQDFQYLLRILPTP